jgi:integrase
MGNVQRTNGRFQGRFRDLRGDQHSKLFNTEAQAWQWVGANEKAAETGEFTSARRSRMTVGEFHSRWRGGLVGLDPSTKDRIDSDFRCHILPAFGSEPLRRIDPLLVANWLAEKEGDLAPASLQNLMYHLCELLSAAIDDKRVPADLVVRLRKQVPIPSAIKGVLRAAMTDVQVQALAEAMSPERHGATVLLAAMTGMRLGEVLGLSVDNVTFLRRQIRVVRQLKVNRERGLHLAPPKTELSRRTLPLPAPLAEALSIQLSRFPSVRVVLPEFDQRGRHQPVQVALVVHNGVGAYRPTAMVATVARAARRANVRVAGEWASFHDLRHHFASLMLARGMRPVELQLALGHSQLSTTLDTYCHFMPGDDEPLQHVVMNEVWGRVDMG